MHYITSTNRHQLQLFNSLDTSICEDNPVRVMDALVDMLYAKEPGKFVYKGQSDNGRKSYHPSTLLKLYLMSLIHAR